MKHRNYRHLETNELSTAVAPAISGSDVLSILEDLVGDVEKIIPEYDRITKKELFPLARIARTVERQLGRELEVVDLDEVFTFWGSVCDRSESESYDGGDDYFEDFVSIYQSTEVPHDEGLWPSVLESARENTSPPGISKILRCNSELVKLASLCYQLHLISDENNGEFYLSVRKANEILPDLSIRAVHKKMRYLQACNIIMETQKGSPTTGVASFYKYIGADTPAG